MSFSRPSLTRLLLVAGREVRTLVASPPPLTAEVGARAGMGEVRPSGRQSFIVTNRDHDPRRLDGAAGCEFVDDRIRLRW